MNNQILKAPFTYFGGKSAVASVVWKHFGDVDNYVEPFAGSLAVLLARPSTPKIETVNDLDCTIANFWRAIKSDPEEVAKYADYPVSMIDICARRNYIYNNQEFYDKMRNDPEYYDCKIAGWWVYGMSASIGDNFQRLTNNSIPSLLSAGKGINRLNLVQYPIPELGFKGKGIKRTNLSPNNPENSIYIYFDQLCKRLKRVRITCCDFLRIINSHSTTTKLGLTGIFLDPPYRLKRKMMYGEDSMTVSSKAREWAIENGDNPLLRIALCGYEGEHEMPNSWYEFSWKTQGGYANLGYNLGRKNKHKERIWFSKYCLHNREQQCMLF